MLSRTRARHRRRAPLQAPDPPAPAPQAPGACAEAWVALYRRRARHAAQPGLIPAQPDQSAMRAAVRTAALRAGDYRETPCASP